MKLYFSLKEFAVVIGILTVFTFVFAPYLDDYPVFRRRNAVCRSNLKEIGELIATYRANHQGNTPADLVAFLGKKNQSYLYCPWNYKEGYSYQASSNSTAIILWDSKTNYLRGLFWRKTIRNRNVLFGNGKVETMDEEDFQKLNLKGTPIFPDKPKN